MLQDDLMFRITPREKTLLDLLMVVIEERAEKVFDLEFAHKMGTPPLIVPEEWRVESYCPKCGTKKRRER